MQPPRNLLPSTQQGDFLYHSTGETLMSNTAEQLDHVVNGIDTSRIVDLATNMTQDENFGQFRFRANNQWIDGSRSRTSFKDFYAGGEERTERPAAHTSDADQPLYLGGQNSAPNAVEHYLGSLVSCLNTTIVAHASAQGIELHDLEISAEGNMDARGFFGVSDEVRRGYNRIVVDIRARTSADEAGLRQMASYSPVYEMVSRAVPVELNITLTD
jgi:uncharacterized OsmC-like protein